MSSYEHQSIDLVIALEVPIREIIDRISERRICSRGHVYHVRRDHPRRAGICDEDGETLFQREDDKEGVVLHRVEIYELETQPLLEMYGRRRRTSSS